MMKKLLLVVVAGLVGLVALAITVLIVDFDSPKLGQVILDQVAARSGIELKAESFHLNLLHGLKLGQVEAKSELPSGHVDFRCELLLLEHRLGPLLRGEVRVDQILLQKPQVVLEQRSAAPEPSNAAEPAKQSQGQADVAAEAEAAEPGSMVVGVVSIRLVDGSLQYRSTDPEVPATEIRGFDLELRELTVDPKAPSPLQGLAALGDLQVDEVLTGETLITGARGRLRLQDGHFVVSGLDFATAQGNFVLSELDVDLNRDPFDYSMAFAGDIDVNAMFGATGATGATADEGGGGFGGARLDLQATGFGAETSDLSGRGVLKVDTGTLPHTPIFAAVDKVLGKSVLVGQRYSLFEVPFHVARNRVRADVFEIGSEELSMAFSGWADLDGALSMELTLRLPREGIDIDEVPDEVLDILSDEVGRVTLPMRIYGRQDSPTVKTDSDRLKQRARQGVKREAKKRMEKELGKALQGLFGKKKE